MNWFDEGFAMLPFQSLFCAEYANQYSYFLYFTLPKKFNFHFNDPNKVPFKKRNSKNDR